MSFDEWKQDATPDEQVVAVCFNRSLFREWTEASERLAAASTEDPDISELADAVVDLTNQVEADKERHRFTFRTVPYSRWRDLVEAHPPTDQQKKRADWLEYNPDSFPPVAVAASCHDPELTDDDAVWLRENLPRLEFDRLFNAAFEVSVGGSDLPKSVVAIARTLASEAKSTTR